MDESIKYIQGKVDKIDERIDSIDKTLAVNTQLLDIHIKRTDLLEKEVSRVKGHVDFVSTLGRVIAWAVGVLSAVGGLVLAILQLR